MRKGNLFAVLVWDESADKGVMSAGEAQRKQSTLLLTTMPRSRTSIRSTQNHAERNHGDGRMAFKHDQSGMIGDTAVLWEDFRSTFALRENKAHCNWQKRALQEHTPWDLCVPEVLAFASCNVLCFLCASPALMTPV